MEEQLLRYRKEKAYKFRQGFRSRLAIFFEHIAKLPEANHQPLIASNEVHSNTSPLQEVIENPTSEVPFNFLKATIWLLIWTIGFILFIYIQFGAVYFCVTCLIFIYFNTRTGQKLKNEISAYSVFNKNCETIEGTFTAEQFEKQVRSGML